MTNGIIVARDGYRVETATVLQQVFNSALNTMKTSVRSTGSSTGSGERTIILNSVAYRCGFMAWFEVDNSGLWFPNGAVEHLSGGACYAACYIDDGFNLKADIYSSGSKTVTVKFVLLVDPGE